MKHDSSDRALGLSTAQVTGSALAAMSGALIASWAGTTGTIIGTAVGSVVATIGAATYTWSLRRTSDAVRRTAAQVRQAALVSGPLPRRVVDGPLRAEEDLAPETETETGTETSTAPGSSLSGERRTPPWGKVLLASAAVTATVLGGITTFEALSGQPVSSLTGRDDSTGTSIGNFVGTDRSPAAKKVTEPRGDDDRAETDEPGLASVTPTPSPTPAPAPTPDPTDPSDEPSVPPAEPTDPVPSSGSDPVVP